MPPAEPKNGVRCNRGSASSAQTYARVRCALAVSAPLPYESNPRHRDGTSGKTQWTIKLPEEEACFEAAVAAGWVPSPADSKVGWGLHLDESGKAQNLGRSADGERRPLWWAKFRGDSTPWHGYPADLARRNPHDQPSGDVIVNWKTNGYITKAIANKLTRRIPCSL